MTSFFESGSQNNKKPRHPPTVNLAQLFNPTRIAIVCIREPTLPSVFKSNKVFVAEGSQVRLKEGQVTIINPLPFLSCLFSQRRCKKFIMSYPGAPGVPKNQSQPSSLPPRPPTSKLPSGFKPAFAAAPSYSSTRPRATKPRRPTALRPASTAPRPNRATMARRPLPLPMAHMAPPL